MARIGKLIITLLLCTTSMAQLPNSPDSLKEFTYGGRSWAFFKPIGWNPATDHLGVAASGNGETNASMAVARTPIGNMINDTLTNWNGLVYMNDGSVKKVAWLIWPNYWDAQPDYSAVTAYTIQTLYGNDTADHRKFFITGISGSGDRIGDYLKQTGHSSPYSNLFDRVGFVSAVGVNMSTWKPYKCHVWVAGSEHDPVTAFTANITTYNGVRGNKRLKVYWRKSHSNQVWNPVFDVSTLSTPNGSTADNNMIRFLLSDGADGINPIKVAGVKTIR